MELAATNSTRAAPTGMIKSTQKSQRSRFLDISVSMLIWPTQGADDSSGHRSAAVGGPEEREVSGATRFRNAATRGPPPSGRSLTTPGYLESQAAQRVASPERYLG